MIHAYHLITHTYGFWLYPTTREARGRTSSPPGNCSASARARLESTDLTSIRENGKRKGRTQSPHCDIRRSL